MQQDIKEITARYLGLIAFAAVGFFIAAVITALTSCTRTEYIAVPEYRLVDRWRTLAAADSVYVHDSVHESLVSNLDTVYITKSVTKYVYKDRVRTDTLHAVRIDSVAVPTPIEKTVHEMRPWQRPFFWLGVAACFAVLCYVVLWLVKRKG